MGKTGALDYEEWLAGVPESLKRDPLWSFQVYPKALLLSDLVWEDTDHMMKDARGRAVARQSVESVGSICANIEEGHGGGFGKENAYFQRVALGSARESRGWYYRSRPSPLLQPPKRAQKMTPPTPCIPHPPPCILHPASCILHLYQSEVNK